MVMFLYCKIDFNGLKLNPTITPYLLPKRNIVSKKSADFTDFWTPIRCACAVSQANENWDICSAYILLPDDT